TKGGFSFIQVVGTTTKNAAKTPRINKRNRLPLTALRCHRDRLSTTILAPFLAVEIHHLRHSRRPRGDRLLGHWGPAGPGGKISSSSARQSSAAISRSSSKSNSQ